MSLPNSLRFVILGDPGDPNFEGKGINHLERTLNTTQLDHFLPSPADSAGANGINPGYDYAILNGDNFYEYGINSTNIPFFDEVFTNLIRKKTKFRSFEGGDFTGREDMEKANGGEDIFNDGDRYDGSRFFIMSGNHDWRGNMTLTKELYRANGVANFQQQWFLRHFGRRSAGKDFIGCTIREPFIRGTNVLNLARDNTNSNSCLLSKLFLDTELLNPAPPGDKSTPEISEINWKFPWNKDEPLFKQPLMTHASRLNLQYSFVLTSLKEILCDVRPSFIVVHGHHPVISSAHHGSTRYLQWLRPLLRRFEVDLYVSGHDHLMQLSWDPDEEVTQDSYGKDGKSSVTHGVWHAIVGSTSKIRAGPEEKSGKKGPEYIWQYLDFGFADLEVQEEAMFLRFITESGVLVRTVEMKKRKRDYDRLCIDISTFMVDEGDYSFAGKGVKAPEGMFGIFPWLSKGPSIKTSYGNRLGASTDTTSERNGVFSISMELTLVQGLLLSLLFVISCFGVYRGGRRVGVRKGMNMRHQRLLEEEKLSRNVVDTVELHSVMGRTREGVE